MNRQWITRSLGAAWFAAALFVAAVPAHAQLGSLHGKVVDADGKPVADADVTFDSAGEQNFHFVGKTDAKGEYTRGGLQLLAGAKWNITVKKGSLSGQALGVDVPKGNARQVDDIVLHGVGGAAAGGKTDSKGKSTIDKAKLFGDVKTLMAASNYDGAIAKLTDGVAKDDKCAQCFVRLGDAYLKKDDLGAAEKAYLQAVAIDDKATDAGEAYNSLAEVYTKQAVATSDTDERKKKLEQAGAMSDKATALSTAAGGAAGGDATSFYNSGISLWNQSKFPEAKAQFQKAVQMNPSMADAHYQLGLCHYRDGANAEAKAEFQRYLQLAPTGENAAAAKAIADSLK